MFNFSRLIDLPDQEWIQRTRHRVRQQFALPTVLLIDDEIEVVEVAPRCQRSLPGLFRQKPINLSGDHQFLPRTKPVIAAEFNGLLPKETRERALAARGHFDDLYLVVDQENRWESELLPDPVPRALDPLLIGEVNQSGEIKHFLIDQFDLTEAEQYLADEFAIKIG